MNEQNTLSKQTAKFIASIAQNLPEISGDVMQGWIQNPNALKKVLAEALCPPESKKSGEEIFVVGEVFQHRNKNLVPQYFGDNFKNWLWASAQTRTVAINAFGKNNLKEYVLPKNMYDTAIQNANNSTPMSEDQFWAMLFLLIINPRLGKEILKYELRKDKVYIFHVKLSSDKVVAVSVDWGGGGWSCRASAFDYGGPWRGGYVFLFSSYYVN